MKALEKDRNRRYESASAFAADVQRFLHDEPVQACPPSIRYRLGKFIKRNRSRLAAASLVLGAGLLVVLVLGVMYLRNAGRLREIMQAVAEDLKEADIFQGQAQWAAALPALERASGRLEGSGLDSLQAQVTERRREVDLVARLEKIRLISAEEPDFAAQDQACRAAFADNGLDVAVFTAEEIAERIRASAIRAHLIRALDHWIYIQDHLPGGNSQPLRAIAQLADDDSWRRQLRDPRLSKDRKALEALAEGETILAQPPESVMNLFELLAEAGAHATAVRLLQRAQPLHPTDFWINFQLGVHLADDPATAADAVGFCRAALVVQPRSPRVNFQLGEALACQGKLPEAELAWRKAFELKPDYAFGYFVRGRKLLAKHKYPEAAAAFQKAIERKPDFAVAYEDLGCVLIDQKDYRQAAAALRKCIDLDPGHPIPHFHLGRALYAMGSHDEAIAAFRKALALHEQVLEKQKATLGPDHEDTLIVMNNLAAAYREAGRPQDVIALYEPTLEKEKATLGPDHMEILKSMNNLGLAYNEVGRFQEAIALYERVLEKQKATLGPDHEDTLIVMNNLGLAYHEAGRFQEAIALHELVLEKRKAKLGPNHSNTLQSRNNLAAAYWFAGQLDRSVPLFEETLRLQKEKLGIDHLKTLGTMVNLGVNYRDAGRVQDAIPLLEEALQRGRKRPGGLPARLAWAAPAALAETYDRAGQFSKAETICRTALEQARQQFGSDDPRTAALMATLGLNLLHQHKYAEAELLLRDCLKVREAKQPDEWTTFNAQSLLGEVLLVQKKYAEAEPLLLQGYQGMKQREAKISPQGKVRLVEAAERLVRLYEATNQPEKARTWREKLPSGKRPGS